MNNKSYKNMSIEERMKVHKHRKKKARELETVAKNPLVDIMDVTPKQSNRPTAGKGMEDVELWD